MVCGDLHSVSLLYIPTFVLFLKCVFSFLASIIAFLFFLGFHLELKLPKASPKVYFIYSLFPATASPSLDKAATKTVAKSQDIHHLLVNMFNFKWRFGSKTEASLKRSHN